MTQIYPAIRAKMGRWDYFMVRMSMRELAENVKFAEEIHGPTQLSAAIQRELNRSRAKGQIASYLANHEDRFFNSLVVAALDGEPQWYPVSIEDIPEFRILSGDRKLSEAFGVLTFNGEQRYYALDGQHRLAAIRTLIDGDSNYSKPQDFDHEEASVIIVMPRQLEEHSEFMVRYRRLFGHLNRYAKSMSKFENIVMDEDDAIAIATRRLVSEHDFFRSGSNDFESSRVKMRPGGNVTPGSSQWTSLEMLYELNARFLMTPDRRNRGWGSNLDKLGDYKRFRPDEEEIDDLCAELFHCWDSLITAMPVLSEDPSAMRDHNADSTDNSDDNVLFWPIVQALLVDLARELMDAELSRMMGETPELDLTAAVRALEPLNAMRWAAHEPPWRHLLLIRTEDDKWRIASEDRQPRVRVASRIVRWQLGLDDLSEEQVTGSGGLRASWRELLPLDAVNEVDSLWEQIADDVMV